MSEEVYAHFLNALIQPMKDIDVFLKKRLR